MNPLKGKTALITGASSGIGEAFAHYLANLGCHLIIVARRRDLLENIADEIRAKTDSHVIVLPGDLGTKEGIELVVENIRQQNIEIEVLINNAGFGTFGNFELQDRERERQEVLLNSAAVVDLCHHFIPDMLEHQEGYIINVASIAGFHPTPFFSVYGATKAFLLSFTEGLWGEYLDRGIKVCALCPGPTKSGFFEASKNDYLKKMEKNMPLMDTNEVVEMGVQAMLEGKSSFVPGWKNYIQTRTPRLIPRNTMIGMVAKKLRPRTKRKVN